MKQFIRDYFTFDRRQRNGVFILLSIIVLLILYLSFSDYFFSNEKTDFSKFEKEIASFEASVKQAEDSASSAHEKYFNAENEDDDSIQIAAKYPVRENKQEKPEKRFENKFPKKDASVTVELNSADTTSLKQLKG